MKLTFFKYFIFTSFFLSLLASLEGRLFPAFFTPYTLESIFSFSLFGLEQWFFWQFFTHIFVEPVETFDLFYLLHLFFNGLILYRVGSYIIVNNKLKHFFVLFLGSTLIVSLTTYLILFLYPFPLSFGGLTPLLFTLLTTTLLLYPEEDHLFSSKFPIKTKWAFIAIASSTFLTNLVNFQFLSLLMNFIALSYSYLYTMLILGGTNPFKMKQIELLLIKLEALFQSQKNSKAENYARTTSKLYDFETGEKILSHEEFLSACKAKIAKEGVKSLSLREKFKLWYFK